jgi:hypothetical protein
MFKWLKEKKCEFTSVTVKEVLLLLVGACIYYSVSMFIMDTLNAPRLTSEHPMIDGAIYITVCFLITIIVLILVVKLFSFKWTVSYRVFTNIKQSGIIDKNTTIMTVRDLSEKLDDYDPDSLVDINNQCIIIYTYEVRNETV